MLGQRLNRDDYVDIMSDKVEEGQFSVETARNVLEASGVQYTREVEARLIHAETTFLTSRV